MARSAFTLAYQPIVALTTGELAGFEALVRWPHPQWGMLQPNQFIALAEETGQIIPLGSWVLGQAAADMARWRQAPGQAPLDHGPAVPVLEGAEPPRGLYVKRGRVGPSVQRSRLCRGSARRPLASRVSNPGRSCSS